MAPTASTRFHGAASVDASMMIGATASRSSPESPSDEQLDLKGVDHVRLGIAFPDRPLDHGVVVQDLRLLGDPKDDRASRSNSSARAEGRRPIGIGEIPARDLESGSSHSRWALSTNARNQPFAVRRSTSFQHVASASKASSKAMPVPYQPGTFARSGSRRTPRGSPEGRRNPGLLPPGTRGATRSGARRCGAPAFAR